MMTISAVCAHMRLNIMWVKCGSDVPSDCRENCKKKSYVATCFAEPCSFCAFVSCRPVDYYGLDTYRPALLKITLFTGTSCMYFAAWHASIGGGFRLGPVAAH